jgi:hypothetical protein
MGSVNLVVIVESVRSLIAKPNNDLKAFHLPSILAVAVALGMFYLSSLRFCHNRAITGVKLLLFFYCYSLRSKSSQVHVLWEDHRNDLFINGFGRHFENQSQLFQHLMEHQVSLCQPEEASWCGVSIS